MVQFEIYDARKTTRTQGPYEDKTTAQEGADVLNTYIYENGLGLVLGPSLGQVIGPYYVRQVVAKTVQVETVALYNGATDPHLENPVVSGAFAVGS